MEAYLTVPFDCTDRIGELLSKVIPETLAALRRKYSFAVVECRIPAMSSRAYGHSRDSTLTAGGCSSVELELHLLSGTCTTRASDDAHIRDMRAACEEFIVAIERPCVGTLRLCGIGGRYFEKNEEANNQ